MNRRTALMTLTAFALTPARAAPVPYRLDAANSLVAFTFTIAGQQLKGTMPVASAEIALDLSDIAASSVSATLDPTRARAALGMATETMRGPGILDADRHPRITFRSTAIRVDLFEGEIDGDLTIRGITRPVTLAAQLYRRRDADDPRRVTIRMTGDISRAAFGATALADVVADTVGIDILARIIRAA